MRASLPLQAPWNGESLFRLSRHQRCHFWPEVRSLILNRNAWIGIAVIEQNRLRTLGGDFLFNSIQHLVPSMPQRIDLDAGQVGRHLSPDGMFF